MFTRKAKFTPKVYSEIKMPKSASAIQNQIDGCERSMTEGLANCASLAGDNNFQFSFSLKGFVDAISTCDVEYQWFRPLVS